MPNNTYNAIFRGNASGSYDEISNTRGGGTSPVGEYEYEESPSLKAHSVDDKIFVNDKYYTVTSAISIGDTITEGTNVTEDTIEEGSLITVTGLPSEGSGGGGGGASAFSELTDVNVSNPSDGQVPKYNTTTSKWENKDLYFSGYAKNGIYRGKDLGTITSANIDAFVSNHAIDTGIFDDLYLGDHFIISDGYHNDEWIIAGFDHYYKTGSTENAFHHITCIPVSYVSKPMDSSANTMKMNSTNTTGVSKNTANPLYATTQGAETNGYQCYYGSDACQIYLPAIATHLQDALGTHLKQTNYLLSNTIDLTVDNGILDVNNTTTMLNGMVKNWEWTNHYAILPSEIEIYGSLVWGNRGPNTGTNNRKLPVFNYIPLNTSRTYFWLQSVVSATYFSSCNYSGYSYRHSASYANYCRPLINIG